VLTQRRATALVAALCLASLGAALGATVAVERAHPGITRPPPDLFVPLPIPRIDVHQHVGPATVELAMRVARADGISALVNLSGGAEGGELEAQLAAARPMGDRVVVFMNLDEAGCCDAAWVAREAARLARGKALGARGLALVDPPKAPLDRLQPIWEACASLGLPVSLGAVGTSDELAALVERHPRVAFIAARFAQGAEDPAAVARLLDRLPNLSVDLAASVPRLGARAALAREAILAHPDRVLFGSDLKYVEDGEAKGIVLGAGDPILLDPDLLGGKERRIFFESMFRFLETRDAAIPSPHEASDDRGGADLSGIGLPREVLERVYHLNAERLLRIRAPRLEE
jgi:predicted TIM-barrel fold metal-dependent hydrolase